MNNPNLIYVLYQISECFSDCTGRSTGYETQLLASSYSKHETDEWLKSLKTKYGYGRYFYVDTVAIGVKPRMLT